MRPSMEAIIAYLRRYGQAGHNEEWNGETYWTDDQLLEIADRNSTIGVVRLNTVYPDNYTSFALDLKRHLLLEDAFTVYGSSSGVIATVSTYDMNTAMLEFVTAVNSGQDYALQGRIVNGYAALADLWGEKAVQRFDYIDWKAQNNRMNMEQEYNHCIKQRDWYRGRVIKGWNKYGGMKWIVPTSYA